MAFFLGKFVLDPIRKTRNYRYSILKILLRIGFGEIYHLQRLVLVFSLSICFPFEVAGQQPLSLKICSFNVQFLGNSKSRDDTGLTEILKKHDIVVVQELIAPPYPGTFPNHGGSYVPDAEARRFFDFMIRNGFSYKLSEEDTGPGKRIHLNSSATEWWVVFYKSNNVALASDLPSGFLSKIRANNEDFDRVPYAFAFRTANNQMDFVLISVHLRPGAGKAHKARRKHEINAIASWIARNDQQEKDFLILGDMNIENAAELADSTPPSFVSLNGHCQPTNTNMNRPKPYDHVMYRPLYTQTEFDRSYGFHVENLIDGMRQYWKKLSTKKYPGDSPYDHNEFRKYYSDHHPIDFKLNSRPGGDDD